MSISKGVGKGHNDDDDEEEDVEEVDGQHVKIRFSLGELLREGLATAGARHCRGFSPAHWSLCKRREACQKRLLMVLNVVKYLSSSSAH